MKKKQIHVVTKFFYPVTGGIEHTILETYSLLAKSGWEIIVHTSTNTLTQNDVLEKEQKHRGITIHRYHYGLFGFFPRVTWQEADIVSLHNFNIFPHFFVLLYSLLAKLMYRKNFTLILTPHGGFNPEWSLFALPIRFIKKLYHYTLGTFLINASVDGIHCVSDWEKQEMIKKSIDPNRLKVITNGIEDEALEDIDKKASRDIKQKVKKYGKYIIQIGRIFPIKNYETVIRALPIISSDINYIIVGPVQGDQGYITSLKNLAKELGVEKRVIFSGVVRGVDKYYLIKKSQLMVHMAIWESYCNVVLEALSQGTITIVANNTALRFLIKNGVNGFVVDTKNYISLAQTIQYILDHQDERAIKKMRKNNRTMALTHSWRHVAYNVAAFYTKSLKKHATSIRHLKSPYALLQNLNIGFDIKKYYKSFRRI